MIKIPLVHLCETDGHLYVLLPSTRKKFRKALEQIGAIPFKSYRPAYRLDSGRREDLLDLIESHYPEWQAYDLRDAPPWVEDGIRALTSGLENLFLRLGPPGDGER